MSVLDYAIRIIKATMNIILQCLSTDDRQNPHFSRAMKQIECLEPEEISGLVDWWNNTLLVGTEESKLALSIIYSEFHNGYARFHLVSK